MAKKNKKRSNIPSLQKGNNDRFRLWFILLYKDTKSYNYKDILFNLKGFKNWAYIEHKKEQKEKKDHIHFILKLDNACTKSAITKKTGIPSNFIEVGKNERALCRYLIHADDEDKIQYDISKVKISRSYERFYKKQLEDKETEDEIISNIYSQIDRLLVLGLPYIKIQPMLIQWLNANCYDTIYKRYRQEFNSYLTMQL